VDSMPRSIATTNRLKRILIALVILSLVAASGLFVWRNSYSLFGYLPTGTCLVGKDQRQVRIEQAQQLWREKVRLEQEIPKRTWSCSVSPFISEGDLTLNEVGLTPRAARLEAAIDQEFGWIPAGGYQPGGVTTGHIPGSAHYEGRAIDYFFRPYDNERNRKRGWQLAQWAVVFADKYDVKTVIFDDHIWTRSRSAQGWRPYTHPSGSRTNPILRHLDHVHIDVG